MTRRTALLYLSPTVSASFSESSGTLGQHRTRPAPTGAALLGWAAHAYDHFTQDEQGVIFHSGRVMFSDAYPVSKKGEVAIPTPSILMYAKHLGAPFEDGQLVKEKVFVGPEAFADDSANEDKQAEALRGGWLSLSGERLDVDRGSRLRTAMEGGRAQKGALFGVQHLKAGAHQFFVATIEAESEALSGETWEQLLGLFDGVTLRIGRSSRTAHGGGYRCSVRKSEDLNSPWCLDAQTDVAEDQPVRVLALSDIALLDKFGIPALSLDPSTIGLNRDAHLNLRESSVSVHRYTPWNAKLRRRDAERCVIRAGSVFTFDGVQSKAVQEFQRIGLHRESGLGLLWINAIFPPTSNEKLRVSVLSNDNIPENDDLPECEVLSSWLNSQSQSQDFREQIWSQFWSAFVEQRDDARGNGPSAHQWREVQQAVRDSLAYDAKASVEFLKNTLFEGDHPVCGREDKMSTRRDSWGAGQRQTFRNWLKQQLNSETFSTSRASDRIWLFDRLIRELKETGGERV